MKLKNIASLYLFNIDAELDDKLLGDIAKNPSIKCLEFCPNHQAINAENPLINIDYKLLQIDRTIDVISNFLFRIIFTRSNRLEYYTSDKTQKDRFTRK